MSGLEYIVVNILGMENSLITNIKENKNISIKIYLIISLIFWSVSHIMEKKL